MAGEGPKLRPNITPLGWFLIFLSLGLLFGITGWNVYLIYRDYANFPRILTDPVLYERYYKRPGWEAQTWREHLKKVSGIDPKGADIITFYYQICNKSPYCQKTYQAYADQHPPFPMERWWWIILSVVPVFFINAGRTPPVGSKASAEWARPEEIKRREREPGSILGEKIHPDSTFLGLVDVEDPGRVLKEEPKKYQYLQLPTSVRSRHILVVAGTGAGKTTTYAMNQIISSAKNGFGTIVFDQKWGARSGLIEAVNIYLHYGLPVYVFTPFSPSKPRLRLPVLQAVDEDDPNSAMVFAEMVVPSSEREDLAHYRENDQALLAGLIMAHITHAKKEGRPPNLGEVVDILSLFSVESIRTYVEINDKAKTLALKVLERPPAKLQEAIPGLRNKLLPFSANAYLREATTEGPPEENLDLEEVFRQPALLYVGIPEKEVRTKSGAVLLRILKHLIDLAIEKVGPLKYPYNFILDEFANFGYLPNVDKNLAMIRDQNVSLHIIVQSMAQGIGVYGEEGWNKTIENNVNTQVWYVADLSPNVQKELSTYLGETTILTESKSIRKDSLIEIVPTITYGLRVDKKPLLTPDEMARSPQGTALVRLPNMGWTVFRAVILSDPRNPFHEDYKRMRPAHPGVIEALKVRRLLTSVAEEKETKTLRPPPSKGDRFRTWVSLLVRASAPMKVSFDPRGKPNKISLLKAPPEAVPPQWLQADFVRLKEGEEAAITAKGIKELEPLMGEIVRVHTIRGVLQEVKGLGKVASTERPQSPGYLVLADPPSGRIYVHVSLRERLAQYLEKPEEVPRVIANQKEDWYVLRAGPMFYGLPNQNELARMYQEIALTSLEDPEEVSNNVVA